MSAAGRMRRDAVVRSIGGTGLLFVLFLCRRNKLTPRDSSAPRSGAVETGQSSSVANRPENPIGDGGAATFETCAHGTTTTKHFVYLFDTRARNPGTRRLSQRLSRARVRRPRNSTVRANLKIRLYRYDVEVSYRRVSPHVSSRKISITCCCKGVI